MMQEGADHLAAAIRLMAHGLHVFLLTDLKETFVMDSDLEFRDYMELGYFRVEETRPTFFSTERDCEPAAWGDEGAHEAETPRRRVWSKRAVGRSARCSDHA